ncbi:EexN family lipoprotein [Herbaspirillum sp. LeCh32-8]|uniref:EexN family lipoprotein n=1 Tax=Herbaspirillum sp. LeCh32-8 TaxID=2821356 RepID=UPI001AE7F4E1|nr:EexN family lipoprotein [Herbaspirillum sp. LeCh32-8]MBP0597625.1 EexN family lipoprotein [Herbaspirillum sp. LeCh32-8]
MNQFIRLAALLCVALPVLSACDAVAGKKDYAYFRQHIDEAKSVADQCSLNGTSGMSNAQIKVCDAAREAYGNRSFSY